MRSVAVSCEAGAALVRAADFDFKERQGCREPVLTAKASHCLAVRWSDVRPGPRKDGQVEYFTAPVSKDNVKQYGIFAGRAAAVEGRGREWRAGELLGDYVSLEDAPNFGSVIDLVFDRQGQLRSVALAPDISGRTPLTQIYSRFGPDAGWDPGDDFVVLPHTTKEVQDLLPAADSD